MIIMIYKNYVSYEGVTLAFHTPGPVSKILSMTYAIPSTYM